MHVIKSQHIELSVIHTPFLLLQQDISHIVHAAAVAALDDFFEAAMRSGSTQRNRVRAIEYDFWLVEGDVRICRDVWAVLIEILEGWIKR